MSMQPRIHIAASRPHYQALQRRQRHSGVHALATEDRAGAATVSEVCADKSARAKRFSQHRRRTLGDESMARAMEAVATDPLLLVKRIRNGIQIGAPGKRMVEG